MSDQKVELELASDLHQSENIEQDNLSQKTKKDKERFEKMVTTQNKIQKIKADLNKLIQSMNNNPSWLSRAGVLARNRQFFRTTTVHHDIYLSIIGCVTS